MWRRLLLTLFWEENPRLKDAGRVLDVSIPDTMRLRN